MGLKKGFFKKIHKAFIGTNTLKNIKTEISS